MKKILQMFLFVLFLVNISLAGTNLLVNGDLETVAPNFWHKLNEGQGGSLCTWDLENGHASLRSLKIEKTSASTDVVGWKSVDNSYLYWNHAKADRLYNLSFWAKTQGVNTNPSTDDQKIGVLFEFYAGGNLLGAQFVAVDQSAESSDWTEYTDGLLIPAGPDPDEMYMTLHLGKEATGTVWFDDIGCGCDPWEMWPFNGNMETPAGWMEWHASNEGFANTVQDSVHSGEWSALMYEWDDNDDEMVFYSEPVAAKPNTWYKISVWAKCDSVTNDPAYLPSNVTPERDNNRLGMCFFFHKAPIDKSWDLTGGDQYFYFDQRNAASDWIHYSVIAKSPEDAAGVSCRARFTSFPVGRVWYDDFSIEELDVQPNILVNGDLETVEPNFWTKLNEGDGRSVCSWDLVNGHNSTRSLKLEKPAVSNDVVGWKSVDNSYLYWNHAKADRLYNLSFWAKTENVNVNPTNDDEKIGVLFAFYNGETLLGEQYVAIDQSVASTDWTEYTDGLLLPAGPDPDGMYMTLMMGKNATGTVWLDDIGCGCDPWEMWPFNGNMETPLGWMEWHAENEGFANTVQDSVHSGEWSAFMHEWDDNDDEMVFYSEPVPAEPMKWYKISVWAKWDSINTDEKYLPSNVTPERDNNRLGMCFFFHKAPIDKSFDLTGGDQYFYFEQRNTYSDWVYYSAIAQAPEDAAGVSCRARFTSFPVGKVWYDDFTIEPVEVLEAPTAVENPFTASAADRPTRYQLTQNYPNPFNPATTFGYSVPEKSPIEIAVYNVLGRKVRTLFNGTQETGNYKIHWDGLDEQGQFVGSGIYLITLKSSKMVLSKKVTLLK